jgi:NAD(P)-dependent dehydrogenase (short-subunit alcohol dehydrogenase family)
LKAETIVGMSSFAGSPQRFVGRTVLITGAGSGIGRACAERLAAEGARVASADLDQDSAHETIAGLSDPDHHFAVGLDVTDVAVVEEVVTSTADHFGGLDVLVNVAGGDTEHPEFEHTDDETWFKMIDLNLLGVVRCCRAAIPHLRRSTQGPAIATIGSINALMALGSEPYSSAKAGLGVLTLNLAAQLAPSGIRVNLVAPGTIRTPVWDDQPGGADRFAAVYPLKRVGEPADVATAVAYLASSDAAWVTGQTLVIDGGLLLTSNWPSA